MVFGVHEGLGFPEYMKTNFRFIVKNIRENIHFQPCSGMKMSIQDTLNFFTETNTGVNC